MRAQARSSNSSPSKQTLVITMRPTSSGARSAGGSDGSASSRATTRFASIQVEQKPRQIGTSNYSLRTLFKHAMTMMTGFSTLPLRLATLVGLCFTLFGFAVLAFVLIVYFIHHGSTPGFPFLASIIAIFSGAQLFALGIIGEYLARMHVRLMEQPSFVVGESTPAQVPSARGLGEHE